VAQEFKLPDVGEGIESGTVVAVLVAEGDRIEVDQPVIELETDKAVVEIPSTVSGVVTKVHVSAHSEIRIGQVVLSVDAPAAGKAGGGEAPAAQRDEAAAGRQAPARAEEIVDVDEEAGEPDVDSRYDPRFDAAAVDTREAGATEGAPSATAPVAPGSAPVPSSRNGRDGQRGNQIPAAPSVRRLARERGVDLAAVHGSGILGRISAEDVERVASGGGAPAAAQAPAAPSVKLPDFTTWGEVERRPMSGIRKATVRSMTTAWASVPMVTHFDKADATDFESLRKRSKAIAEAAGVKLTPTAMLLKVVASALRKFPDFNASLDVERQEIVYKRYVNVGVAVDTEHGLLVPVVKHADRKSMLELAGELGALADRARARKLGPDDMSGGNFSISNLGGIGGTGFTPIVNPPDVAILGVSRSAYEPHWDAATERFVPRLVMPLALSYDHRLIDGASAARFLRSLCEAIEDPFRMVLEG
jgi:pyruvate dehydrogenase E2 component (dihydrolipoamide acetyltransferase)